MALTLMAVMGILAFAPKENDPLEKIITALEKWVETNPQEKVYIHTDRPYYLVGDTIWFKAYVTVGAKHQLSALSGAVYVDLINEKDSISESYKLPLLAGMAKGEFVLPDTSAKDGNYRIRAYTQWMRNAGPEYFYDKVIKVGNSITNPVFATITYEYPADGKAINATILYTDEKGEPYANKMVVYEQVEDNELLMNGRRQTDEKGELHVGLKPNKKGTYNASHLVTTIEAKKEQNTMKSFLIKSVASASDIQFFPEGGLMVNGVRTKVAFKAINTGGNGINVKGVVTDQNNAQVGEFESTHLGMGFFQFTPETGKSYQAKVTYPDGSEKIVKLPAATDNGYVLSVFNNLSSDTIVVRIRTSAAALKGDQHVGLVAQAGGTVFFASDITVSKAAITIPIPAKDFPSGIMQFTLFSSAGVATNERIVCIQRKDGMNLEVSTAKKEYKIREKTDVNFDVKDLAGQPVNGSFSVSVYNESSVPVDETKENTIFSHILLSSDIKGYIETPNYYFYNPTEETSSNLDILMMTQGYRRFNWKDLTSGKPYVAPLKAEKMLTEVTGKMVTLGGKPVVGGKVLLFNNKLGVAIDTVTDAQGKFRFGNLLITNGISFSVQGRNAKGGKLVEVILDRTSSQVQTINPNVGDVETDFRKVMAAVLENSRAQENELLRRGQFGRTQQLQEVKIRAGKRKGATVYGFSIPEGHADQTLRPDPRDNYKDVLEFLTMRLGQVVFRMEDTGECGPIMIPYSRNERLTIYLNGRRLSPCENLAFYENNPADIIKVEVVRTNLALINMIGGPAIIVTTKFGAYRTRYAPEVANISPQGFNNTKEFYSPKYKHDGQDTPVADFRSTVYWNPSVKTVAGKGTFDFFNADSKGNYRVVIEGMDANGLLGRQVYHYEVK
ncbi:MAG: TonB-dependent receptor [Bacteroidota bacterium]